MPINIPTLKQIQTDVVNDLQSKLNINIPFFGKTFLLILAGVQAAKIRMLYLYLELVQKNIFVDTADPESIGGTLERFGRVKLGRNRFAASNGRYLFDITGSIGGTIPPGVVFRSNDNISYINESEYILTSGTGQIELRSLETGSKVRLSIDQELTMTRPIQDVDKIAIVANEEDQPKDEESIDEYREACIQAFQLEPQGGAPSDYRIWAKDAQGVNNSYIFAKSGESGALNIYIEATIEDSTDGKGTPTQEILDDVYDPVNQSGVVEFDPDITKPLEERGRRPVQAWVYVLPITPNNVEVIVNNPVGFTEDTENFAEIAIQEYIDTVRPYVAGADVPENRNDVLSASRLSASIYNAIPKGVYFNSITMIVDGVSRESLQFLEGNIPYLVSVTFS